MSRERLRIGIRGAVQGVGYRPFVYRLAKELRLGGFVRNQGSGVVIEAEGEAVAEFVERLAAERPSGARVDGLESLSVPVTGDTTLKIVVSEARTSPPNVVPDRVTCEDCLADVLDPASRFYRYPFTNCTRCGPRYSIVDRVPYDRANTAMVGFPRCAACRAEYEDPGDRRFHAQPIACPICGPRLTLCAGDGAPLHREEAALAVAADRLIAGDIVALKGLGGYQLLADAANTPTVGRLRERKHRPHKPFAIMVSDLAAARALCHVDAGEAELLQSPAGPIVLLCSKNPELAEALHPHHVETGVMLPTTPLHHLLLRRVARPVICTSGNVGDEPICTDDADALRRLGGIADCFLTHDRPIRRAVDDSLVRVVDGAPQVLRLARGYAPTVLPLGGGPPGLAVGPHQKNALSLRDQDRVVVGPHVGDLTSTRSVDAMRRQAGELARFFAVRPERVACDLHPDYASTVFAKEQGRPVVQVQHHLAHALAAMVEHGRAGPVLAVVWDGTGLGTDGTIWGGEFLAVDRRGRHVHWERVAHLRPFRLPGGDAASRHPERVLAGLLFELPGHRARIPRALSVQLEKQLNAPWCTSAGRLIEGVAAVLGHVAPQTYEGMAACRLERDARRSSPETTGSTEVAPLAVRSGRPAVLDWAPTLHSILREFDAGRSVEELSAAFHRSLAAAIAGVARNRGQLAVVLTGGCFQNRVLTDEACRRLRAAGTEVLLARQLPPNDGGIAVGQLAAIHGVIEHVPSHSGPY